MKTKLLIQAPWEEFHCYSKMNAFLHSIRSKFEKIVVIAPKESIGIFTEADEQITTTSLERFANYLDSKGNHGDQGFFKKANDYFESHYNPDEFEILRYTGNHILDLKTNEIYFSDFCEVNLEKTYLRDLKYFQKYLEDGCLFYPRYEIFDKIKRFYQDRVNENCFLVLTRNFKYKAPELNTLNYIHNFEEFINRLIDFGHSVVNLGFPPEHIKIQKNYIEIDEHLTEEEICSLTYLSKGIILFGHAGGYYSHSMLNSNQLVLTHEFLCEALNISVNQIKGICHPELICQNLSMHHIPQNDKFDDIDKMIAKIQEKKWKPVDRIFSHNFPTIKYIDD